MEVPSNPNEALTPYFDGDRIIWIPVIDYYKYMAEPELAKRAIELTMKEEDKDV